MKLEAVLVWGTDGAKPPDRDLKDLEPGLAKKLDKMHFKWKNYFEVSRKTATVAAQATKQISMSERCSLEIKNLGGDRIETKHFGQGKQVLRRVDSLPQGETVILAGDDKNDNAWLIILRQTPGKK
jgi:hypothetical protein